MNNDLDGFTVWESDVQVRNGYNNITMTVESRNRTVRFSSYGLKKIGSPKYVNVFFDEHKQRLAIKPTESKYPNAVELKQPQKMRNRTAVFSVSLVRKINALAGIETLNETKIFPGYEYSGYLIFDLAKGEK